MSAYFSPALRKNKTSYVVLTTTLRHYEVTDSSLNQNSMISVKREKRGYM